MESALQRRIQRYGWDMAAADYEPLWHAQLAVAQEKLLSCAALAPGERVLDVACGTGLVTLAAATAIRPFGRVVGVDLSERMVDAAQQRALSRQVDNADFARMDAEKLALPDAGFDVALCALGLMYMPSPAAALHEMRRVLRPGGRLICAVWGERARCGWAEVFPIIDAEVRSEVCPLFFHLGQKDALANLCAGASFENMELHRIKTTLDFADAEDACNAAFIGGPGALAWSRFDEVTRARVRERYIASIATWQDGRHFRVPGEFVIVSATAPGT